MSANKVGKAIGDTTEWGTGAHRGIQGTNAAVGKAFGDVGGEWERVKADPWKTARYAGLATLYPVLGPGVAAAGVAKEVDNAGGMAEIEHHWNTQLSPRYAKNYRQDRRQARSDAETAARMQRQDNYFSGLAGGGAGLSAEIEAYNQIIAQFAAQQQQLKMQNSQNTQQSLGALFQLLAMLGGGA